MDKSRITFVVYDPPTSDFPYLSAIFFPNRDEPMVTPFGTAAEAEAFNKRIAVEYMKGDK